MTSPLENLAITTLKTSYPLLSSFSGCDELPAAFLSKEVPDKQLLGDLKKCYNKVTQQFSDFNNLSLYHFAAIGNRVSVLTQLFKGISLINNLGHFKDSQGNSPLHLRVMLTNEKDIAKDPFIKTFLQKCESKSIDCTNLTNNAGLTYLQLFKLVQQQPSQLPESFNAKCFENKKYNPTPIVSQQALLKLWLKNVSTTADTKNPTVYFQGLQNPPKLLIQPKEKSKNCITIASEDIPHLKIVTEVGGQFTVDPSTTLAKSANFLFLGTNPSFGLDFSKYKNAASFILDGPPNCIATPFSNLAGLPQRALVLSLGIKAGEQLFLDYGLLHTPKYTDKKIHHLSIVIDFIQKASKPLFSNWESYDVDITDPLDGSSDTCSASSQKFKNVGMYKYILSTPAVTFKLIQDGLINHLDLHQAMNSIYPQTFRLNTLVKGHLLHAFLLASIRDVLKDNPTYFDTLYQIIMDNFGKSMTSLPSDPGLGRLFFIHHYIDNFFKILDKARNNILESEETLKNIFELKESSNLKNTQQTLATQNPQFIEALRAWYTNAIDEYCEKIFIAVNEHVETYGHHFAESGHTSVVDYTATINEDADKLERHQTGPHLNLNYSYDVPSKYTSNIVNDYGALKNQILLQKAITPFSAWPKVDLYAPNNLKANPSEDEVLRAELFQYIISTPSAAFKLIQNQTICAEDLKQVIKNTFNQQMPNKTIYLGNLFNMFLLASSADILIKSNQMAFFNQFINIVFKNYERAAKVGKENFDLTRLLFIHHHFIIFNDLLNLTSRGEIYSEETMQKIISTADHNSFFAEAKAVVEKGSEKDFKALQANIDNAINDFCSAFYEKMMEEENRKFL